MPKFDYTHFKGENITRCELVERMLVDLIIESCKKAPDEKRAWSRAFELKHSSGVIQVGRILAQKRGVNVELSAIACALHDLYVNESGEDSGHAAKGVALAEKLLKSTSKFTDAEINAICSAVKNHSDKHIFSEVVLDELVKDADVFECSLYDNMKEAYMAVKPYDICKLYFERIKKVRAELGLPVDKQWDI